MADNVCGKCEVQISPSAGVESVKCADCNTAFHVKCTGIDTSKKLSRSVKTVFRCEKCRSSGPAGSNSDQDEIDLKSLMDAINKMRGEITGTIDTKITTLEDKIEARLDSKFLEMQGSISNFVTTVRKEIQEVKEVSKSLSDECADLRKNNDELGNEVGYLKSQIQDLQQYSRLQNLEISGIPVTNKENIYSVLQSIAEAINTPWHREDICTAHRLYKREDGRQNIVVRFVSRSTRAAWLLAAKQKKGLDAAEVSNSFRPGPVYINEHLTPYVKALLSRAKKMVKDRHLAYAWVKEGKLLVKTTVEGRATRIWGMNDLDKISQPRGPK